MINLLTLAGVCIFGGACFALGMYVASQIGDWINKQIKNGTGTKEKGKKIPILSQIAI